MRPLAGLRVLDMTRLLPGPAATMHLADFGADVIKVEDTGAGDYMRDFPPLVSDGRDDVNPAFAATNRGKRSVAIDLKRAEGREVLLALVRRADALIESFRPGVLQRLGLGWEELHSANPRLVLCSLSGYGQSGPMHDRAGHDLNYLAMTGVLDQIRADGEVAIPNLQIGDLLGGSLTTLSALLIALIGAQRSGQGCRIDAAMTDSLLSHQFFANADVDAGSVPIAGQTLLTGGVACYRSYRAADGREIAVGALEFKFWTSFCHTIGMPELVERHWSRGESPGSRAAADTIERVASRIAERTAEQWLQSFESVDACVTPVLDPAEARDHPHHRARQLVQRTGVITHVGPLARIDGNDNWQPQAAPRQGEHTRQILEESGFGPDRIAALFSDGVVRQA